MDVRVVLAMGDEVGEGWIWYGCAVERDVGEASVGGCLDRGLAGADRQTDETLWLTARSAPVILEPT